jgi:uncharacterized protein (DUF2236 family)
MTIEVLDTGLFGPESESWRTLAERSVVLGGMRALLMQAAHPLVAAAGRQSQMYETDPWGRLERTLRLTFALVFGTTPEAKAAARRINAVHRTVVGIDTVTRQPYNAQDPALLLWVHASLTSSFLLLERLTVGRLNAPGRQRFHEEAIRIAGLLGLPRECVPATVSALDKYVEDECSSGTLQLTEGAQAVQNLMESDASGVGRVKSHLARFIAFHTLPPQVRDLYGIRHGRAEQRRLAVLCGVMRASRPVVPAKVRLIPPAIAAHARLRGAAVRITDVPVSSASRWGNVSGTKQSL